MYIRHTTFNIHLCYVYYKRKKKNKITFPRIQRDSFFFVLFFFGNGLIGYVSIKKINELTLLSGCLPA